MDDLGIAYEHDGTGATGDDAPLTGYSPSAGELLRPGQSVVLST